MGVAVRVGGVPAPPAPGTSAEDVHRWWEGLTPDQQGNYDGVRGSLFPTVPST